MLLPSRSHSYAISVALLFTFCIAGQHSRAYGAKREKQTNEGRCSTKSASSSAWRSLPAAQESQTQSQSQSRSQSQTQFQSLCHHLRAEHQKCTASELRRDFFEFAYLCRATNLNIVMRATKDMKCAQDHKVMSRRVYTLTTV